MKRCPVCGARLFEDMEVCFGCLYRFDSSSRSEAERPSAHLNCPSTPTSALSGDSALNVPVPRKAEGRFTADGVWQVPARCEGSEVGQDGAASSSGASFSGENGSHGPRNEEERAWPAPRCCSWQVCRRLAPCAVIAPSAQTLLQPYPASACLCLGRSQEAWCPLR